MALLELTVAASALAVGIRTIKRHPKKNLADVLSPNQCKMQRPRKMQSSILNEGPTIEQIKLKWLESLLGEVHGQYLEYDTKVKATVAPVYQGPMEKLKRLKQVATVLSFDAERKRKLGMVTSSMSTSNEINEEEKKANQDIVLSLASLGCATAAFIYPPFILGSLIGITVVTLERYQSVYRQLFKERRTTLSLLDAVYFTIILVTHHYFLGSVGIVLSTLGQKLLAKTKDNSRHRLINIFGEQPQYIWRLVNGVEIETPLKNVQKDDIIVVCSGQTIPVDGQIVSGIASINQHRLTGEGQPVEKTIGDTVLAATIVLSGTIHVQVEKAGSETFVAQIGDILSQTADFKLAVQSQGEAFADKSVLPTLAISGAALPILGASGALATLTCPFGWFIRMTAPLSLLNFLHILSQSDVLVKDARSLELLNRVDTVVFDKTGTLTLEQPHVSNIYTCNGFLEDELLQYAATAEWKQTHPIAKAILHAAEMRNLQLERTEDAHYEVGYGIQVTLSGQFIRVGSDRFMEMEGIGIPTEISERHADYCQQGCSLVMVAVNDELAGAIELQATIRPEVKTVIDALRQRKKTLYIISGDNEEPTQKLANELGIDHYFARALPNQKGVLIDQLQAEGRAVCFVGDGINDSIALKKASVSISLSGATTAATDIAQIVLMDGSLQRLPMLFDVASEMQTNMKNNMVLSVIPGVICVGGVFLFHFGLGAGILTFLGGLLGGVGNTLLPLFKHRDNNHNHL